MVCLFMQTHYWHKLFAFNFKPYGKINRQNENKINENYKFLINRMKKLTLDITSLERKFVVTRCKIMVTYKQLKYSKKTDNIQLFTYLWHQETEHQN